MKIAPHRIAPWLALMFALLTSLAAPAAAQQHQELQNARLEDGEAGNKPPGWLFNAQGGAECSIDIEAPFEGKQSARIDASALQGRGMSNIMQTLDATPWRGKRVRYRAAVKTAELDAGIGAQLWFRVDRPKDEGGNRQLGAFDNMGNRPITNAEWKHYDIVLDVEEDAERIVLGMFLLGKGKAWIDDVSMEVVDESVKVTGGGNSSSSSSSRSRGGYQMPAIVREALGKAQDAPQQSFWTWWLLLPVFAIALFVVGMWPMRQKVVPQEPPVEVAFQDMGWLRYFALRFTVCYWLLYCLPGPFTSVIRAIGQLCNGLASVEWMSWLGDGSTKIFEISGKLDEGHRAFESWMAHRSADWFFGIEGQLVPPNDSGDTTMAYLTLLNYFVLALLLATTWTVLLRRIPSRNASVDLLRTYLRYVLALAMLGYGLAKVNMAGNQFPEVNEYRLNNTWGETSPMGLVWGFMGASRPYTIFAGMGEVVAAALLIWRHTALLGAIVAVAVMTNVVMLNYCYDVPVKIDSTHLTLMGLLILVPDARRLLSLLMFQRNPTDQGTPSVWAATNVGWLRWVPKTIVVGLCFLYPMGQRAWDLATYEPPTAEGEAKDEDKSHLLVDRGYRWINEVPFNR